MSLLRVLHLVGSGSSEFYSRLSREYAECCLSDTSSFSSRYDFRIALISPGGQWRFPSSLNVEEIEVTKSMSMSDAIGYLQREKIDLMLSHMYCLDGMTAYRSLFDLMKIPYIGSPPDAMAIAAHKGKAKAIVGAAGVNVPRGELLRRGELPRVRPPSVVKPVNGDNSLGVSLVRNDSEYDSAVHKALEHSDEVLVEAFIEAGREVRCSLIVRDGQLICLPLEEFLIDRDERAIRTHEDKFPTLDANTQCRTWTTSNVQEHWIVDLHDPITEKVQRVAKKCHRALGCRHYSMFDFRIDPQGEVWFLEAGLYCSFGYGSGIPHVAKAQGILLDELFEILVKETLETLESSSLLSD